MGQAALKHPRVTTAVSLPQLAELLGVHRQRIYLLHQRGLIKTMRLRGGIIVLPEEANRVLDSATQVTSPKGVRTLFNLPDDRI